MNLREDVVLEPLNAWIGRAFDRENRDATVAELVASEDLPPSASGQRQVVKWRLADATSRFGATNRRSRPGVDPSALVEVINQAQAERAAAEAELASLAADNTISAAEVYAMIDSLGDVGAALNETRSRTT